LVWGYIYGLKIQYKIQWNFNEVRRILHQNPKSRFPHIQNDPIYNQFWHEGETQSLPINQVSDLSTQELLNPQFQI
jgi:hypothetical protein